MSPAYHEFVSCISFEAITVRVTDALPYSKWKAEMIDEIIALEKNGTWELIELPHGKKTVSFKVVYALKYNPDGSI